MCLTKETELKAWDDAGVLFAGLRPLKKMVQSHLSYFSEIICLLFSTVKNTMAKCGLKDYTDI